jgi:predicted thioredoxin/glutaredoxin
MTPEELEEIEALIDKKVARVIALIGKVDHLMAGVHELLQGASVAEQLPALLAAIEASTAERARQHAKQIADLERLLTAIQEAHERTTKPTPEQGTIQ